MMVATKQQTVCYESDAGHSTDYSVAQTDIFTKSMTNWHLNLSTITASITAKVFPYSTTSTGSELILVSWQSARSGLSHKPDGRLPLAYFTPGPPQQLQNQIKLGVSG